MATLSHYLDLQLRPDPETAPTQLLAALYTRLHRALAAQGSADIAVSFPDYSAQRHTLGERLRLHGSEAALQPWATGAWLGSLRDHVSSMAAAPLPVPAHATHRTLRRIQVKSSPERLRRRLMRRHNLNEQEARQRIPDDLACFTPLPFLQLHSASTGQTFRLFIEHGPIQPSAVAGAFNAYGLSQEGTIPWF